jgi:thiamine pyrophosphokinase
VPWSVSFQGDIVICFQNVHQMGMTQAIVHSLETVTLVGGGHATSEDLREALKLGPKCVAADGGAAMALGSGILPEAVIGDFDSLDATSLARIPLARQHRITEQDSTDFDKALRHIEAPLVIGIGFAGGRIDHQLAAFHTLFVHADRPCILLAETEIVLLAPPDIRLPTETGEVVSLYPLGPVTGRSSGLEWPLDGIDFAPGERSGTSNRATGEVHLEMDAPGMLLILPRRLIQPVAAQLIRPTAARWHARAGQRKSRPPS